MTSPQLRRSWFQRVRPVSAATGTLSVEADGRFMDTGAWIGQPGRALDAALGVGEIGRMRWLPPRGERRALVAPALLLGLALAQLGGWSGFGLSPWKGGGFGMFATNDHGAFRSVRVVELRGGAEGPVALPSELDRLRRHAREVPRPENLRRLAEALRARTPGLGPLRVEVWRTDFSHVDLRPRLELVAQAELR